MKEPEKELPEEEIGEDGILNAKRRSYLKEEVMFIVMYCYRSRKLRPMGSARQRSLATFTRAVLTQ